MMCVCFFFIIYIFIFRFLFVSYITVWGSKTASIIFNGILFDWKVNLVGAFGRLKFRKVFKSAGENNIITMKKRECLLKFGFRQNRFWCLV